MSKILLWALLPTISIMNLACTSTREPDDILQSKFEVKIISSGENMPAVNLNKNNLKELLVMLYYQNDLDDIKRALEWDERKLIKALSLLVDEGLVQHIRDKIFIPSCMVIPEEEGKKLDQLAIDMAPAVARLIKQYQESIGVAALNIRAFKELPAESYTLFLFSNVLLDNWQIRKVEEKFLKARRPVRKNKSYYLSIQENTTNAQMESFGIYGNQIRSFPGYFLGIYGNQRHLPNLINLSDSLFLVYFDRGENGNPGILKEELLQMIINLHSKTPSTLPADIYNGLEKLRLISDGCLMIPVFSLEERNILDSISLQLTDPLIKILESYRQGLENAYQNSPYFNQTGFEEYFIWWYHFLYSRVTDVLIRDGMIILPPGNTQTYIMER